MNQNKRRVSPWVWGILAVIAVVVIFFISTYNSLAKSSQDVDSQWAQVENQMQRRYDLIPNLVNSVKGSMGQEQKVFGDIAKARTSYGNAKSNQEKMDANGQLDQSVGTLINVIGENYPTLGSNANVQTLMTQLEGTENRIATERKRYNDAVSTYNKTVVGFPKNIVANMMGLGSKTYFKAVDEAKTAPTVDFGNTTSTTSSSSAALILPQSMRVI